jgi:hypothetical protein
MHAVSGEPPLLNDLRGRPVYKLLSQGCSLPQTVSPYALLAEPHYFEHFHPYTRYESNPDQHLFSSASGYIILRLQLPGSKASGAPGPRMHLY